MTLRVALGLSLALLLGGGCGAVEPSSGRPDASLRLHVVEASEPSGAGLNYIAAIADVHRRADADRGERRLRILREGLAMPVPADLSEAEILRLELATRLARELLERPGGAGAARDLLVPLLAPERSLALDRATAEALVTLGDAARTTEDDALAAGSYARSIRLMSVLRQELEP